MSWLNLSRVEIAVFVITVVSSVVGRLHAFWPAFSIDDYSLLQQTGAGDFFTAAAQGRVLVFVMRFTLAAFGALPPHTFVLGCVAMHVVLSAVGLYCCRLWKIQHDFWLSVAVCLLIVLHPYQTEIFTFKTALLFAAVALGLAFLGLTLAAYRGWRFAAGVVCFAASLLVYQVVANYAAMVLLFAAVIHYTRGELRRSGRLLGGQIRLILIAVVVYYVVTLSIAAAWGIAMNSRSELLRLGDVVSRLYVVGAQLTSILFGSEPILPRAVKYTLVAGAVIAVFGRLVQSEARARFGWGVLIAVCAGLPMCVGLVVLLREWWSAPRMFAHMSLFWAGLFALSMPKAPKVARRAAGGLLIIVVLSFIGISNHVLSDQIRVNVRDIARVNRIIARVETLPEYRQISGVVLHGGYWGFRSPLTTQTHDMNVSLLFAPWTKRELLNEISGLNLEPAPSEVVSQAQSYCTPEREWPAPEAVTIIGRFAVVCLEK